MTVMFHLMVIILYRFHYVTRMMAGILKELEDGRTGAVHQLFKQLTEGGSAGRVHLRQDP